LIKSQLLYH